MSGGALARQRCWSHAGREAVSRCPECRRFYCRECVTEHDGRLLCVQCLGAKTAAKAGPVGTRWALWAAAALLGLVAAYAVFHTAGWMVEQIPPAWARGQAE